VKDAAGSPDVPEELLNKLNCNEFAITPLIAEGVVLGVLWADNAITKSPIEHHDIEKLRAFAINASLAIEKSELYKVNVEKVLELDIAYRELKKTGTGLSVLKNLQLWVRCRQPLPMESEIRLLPSAVLPGVCLRMKAGKAQIKNICGSLLKRLIVLK